MKDRIRFVERQAGGLRGNSQVRPNLSACKTARSVRSLPVMPIGKPR